MMMGMVATMCQLRNAWSEARDKQAEAMGVVQNAKLLAAQAALAEAEAAQERLEVGHPSPPLSSLLTPHRAAAAAAARGTSDIGTRAGQRHACGPQTDG